MLVLSEELLAAVGPILAVERPSQGLYFDVSILTTARGRFVLKVARTESLVQELAVESALLRQLQGEAPFVATPIAGRVVDGVGSYLFTCIEGDNLLDALLAADATERNHLLAGFGQALRRIHGWRPSPPPPGDWLARQVALAVERVATGSIPNPIQSRGLFGGASPAVVLDEVLRGEPAVQADLVFGHGDYALTNAIARDGVVVGIIDWSAGGWMDRRVDLAAAVKSIRRNLRSEEAVQTFLAGYGYAESPESLRFFEALATLT